MAASLEQPGGLLDVLSQLRDVADTLLQIKATKGSDGTSNAPALTATCAAAGTALLLRARELERQAMLCAQGLRDANSEQRSRLDHNALALHNLVYEQQYYDKEIASCRAFASGVPEAAIGSATPPQAQHKAELARLTDELQHRKDLKAQLHGLEATRAREHEARAAAQAQVDDLRSHLAAISSHFKPLLEASLPACAAIQDDKQAAELLPLPLYVIYSQAATAAAIVGLPLRVAVQGSVAAAQQEQQAQQQQAQDQQQQPGQAGGGQGAGAAGVVSAHEAKRRRKSVQQDDKTYKVHPLSVSLEIYQQSSGQGVRQLLTRLTLSYYTMLQLVGVAAGTADGEDLLTHLFLGDTGDGQLLEAAAACSSSGVLQFAEAGRPRPFRWAQDLGGVDLLSSLPSAVTGIGADRSQVLSALSAYRSKLRLETLVERVAAAKLGQRQLKRILEQLARKEQPSSALGSKQLTRIETEISAWKHLGDVGMQQQGPTLYNHGSGAGQLPGIQEEGELVSQQLQHGDTAEELLLQGLLEDARPQDSDGAGAGPPLAIGDGTAQAAGDAEVLLLEDGGYEEGMLEDDVEPERSGDSAAELLLAGDAAAGADSAAAARALLASHSLYRLVLKVAALEAHFHVMVFHAYPLCPPVFQVTKMLDLRAKDAPTPISDVNEVLALHQQVNDATVQEAMLSEAGEVLAVQVLRLRQCIDIVSSKMRGESSKDLFDNLRAKQQLQGRDRQPRLVTA